MSHLHSNLRIHPHLNYDTHPKFHSSAHECWHTHAEKVHRPIHIPYMYAYVCMQLPNDLLVSAYSFLPVQDLFVIPLSLQGCQCIEWHAFKVVVALSIAAMQIDWMQSSISQLQTSQMAVKADVVVMNPPFGTRRKGADLEFLRAAFQVLPQHLMHCFRFWLHRLETVACNLVNTEDALQSHYDYRNKEQEHLSSPRRAFQTAIRRMQ